MDQAEQVEEAVAVEQEEEVKVDLKEASVHESVNDEAMEAKSVSKHESQAQLS